MNPQIETESSNTSPSRSSSHDSANSSHTVRPTPQTPPRAPKLNTPSAELFMPQMNPDYSPGYNTARYEDSPGIRRVYGLPSKDAVLPPRSQRLPDNPGTISQRATSAQGSPMVSQAMQGAIDRAVETAVHKAMKLIQKDTIQIMEDFIDRYAKMENDKAIEFKRWFNNRLAKMDDMIQQNEGDVSSSRDRDAGENESASVDGEISSDGLGGTSAPEQGGFSTPVGGRTSGPQKPSLVSDDNLLQYALDLTSPVGQKGVGVLPRKETG
jgi:hypothetical protein